MYNKNRNEKSHKRDLPQVNILKHIKLEKVYRCVFYWFILFTNNY